MSRVTACRRDVERAEDALAVARQMLNSALAEEAEAARDRDIREFLEARVLRGRAGACSCVRQGFPCPCQAGQACYDCIPERDRHAEAVNEWMAEVDENGGF